MEKGSHDPLGVFYDLALADVRMAADVLLPVHRATGGADGFVSFELEPASPGKRGAPSLRGQTSSPGSASPT